MITDLCAKFDSPHTPEEGSQTMSIAISKDASPHLAYAVISNMVKCHEEAGIDTISVKALKEWLDKKKDK